MCVHSHPACKPNPQAIGACRPARVAAARRGVVVFSAATDDIIEKMKSLTVRRDAATALPAWRGVGLGIPFRAKKAKASRSVPRALARCCRRRLRWRGSHACCRHAQLASRRR
jgi:hypothetical protein